MGRFFCSLSLPPSLSLSLSLSLSATITTILSFTVLCTTQTNNYVQHYCGETGNFTNTTTYATNLNQLFSSLSSNVTTSNGYQNISSGQDPDRIYGSFMCRGDITPQLCKTCVDSATDVIKRCPNQKQSIIFFDHCVLRYSNQSFFSVMQTQPGDYSWNDVIVRDPEGFNQVLRELLKGLIEGATNGSSKGMFMTMELNFTSFDKIYGLVQCSPDILPRECEACLRVAIIQIPTCCDGRLGVRFVQPSCNLRYQIYPFYETRVVTVSSPAPPPPASPLLLPPQPQMNSAAPEATTKNTSRIVLIVVIPLAIALAVLCITIFCLCRRKRRPKSRMGRSAYGQDVEEVPIVESLRFDFETVRAATDDFSDSNKLGEGGFGVVYKGQLANQQQIAVKRLSRHSGQGEEEFKNEIVLVAKLRHRNIVRLIGFCFEGQERLLIYEFVPNTSLDCFIFDPVKRADLNWETRYRIIGGIARGILYLHEDSGHRVIHRDLKASNVLLDSEMNPKISDFGMARLSVLDLTHKSTSRIAGTYGYMAPEYATHGRFSVKSDVFSFGVLLLEIVTGLKSSSFHQSEQEDNLLSYVSFCNLRCSIESVIHRDNITKSRGSQAHYPYPESGGGRS